jgi:hypothetical protein
VPRRDGNRVWRGGDGRLRAALSLLGMRDGMLRSLGKVRMPVQWDGDAAVLRLTG